jgi:hypothetical protein
VSSPQIRAGGGTPRQVADKINQIARGRIDSTGTVTLTASAASTTVSDEGGAFAYESSVILLSPLTANAAAEIGAGTIYVSGRSRGSFTLTHANNAQTDRTFGYVVLG